MGWSRAALWDQGRFDMKHFTLAMLLIASLPTLLWADEDAVKKYRNFTPEQIKALPESELHKSVPMMYSLAARTGLAIDSNLLFAMELNRLMYPGIGDYESAVKAFQRDLGDPPTGVLTVWQIHMLEQRSEMQKLSRVLFPDQFSSWIQDGVAEVQGAMTILGDNIMWPINHVTVSCYKAEAYCRLDRVSIDVPDEKSWGQNYQVIEDMPEFYTVANWAADSIAPGFVEAV